MVAAVSPDDEQLDPGSLGPTLIVAPHPDDESIGCGGLIASLRRRDIQVWVTIETDGSGSHPRSEEFPAERLAALRAAEAAAALARLGVDRRCVFFGSFVDRLVPDEEAAGFAGGVGVARALLERLRPSTLVLPSSSDAHGDHRALAAIWCRAAGLATPQPRVLDYVVWPHEDRRAEGRRFALDIAEVLPLKRGAIGEHRSQLGLVVTDDPQGFVLPEGLLALADRPWEFFFERAR